MKARWVAAAFTVVALVALWTVSIVPLLADNLWQKETVDNSVEDVGRGVDPLS